MATSDLIKGRVKKGEGKAEFFVQIAWVQQQCKKKFGFQPYPGTLNIKVDNETIHRLDQLPPEQWDNLTPPDDTFCASSVLPVLIKGTPALIIRPEKDANVHKKNVLEILSPLCLRKVYDLKDQCTIELEIGPDSGVVKNRKLSIKAVLFDLDGTLIDSIESYYRIVETAIEKMEFPCVSRTKIAESVGNEGFDWTNVLPAMDQTAMDQSVKRAWQVIEQLYPKLFLNNVDVFPDTEIVLRTLHDKGIRIGIVTATPRKNIKDKLNILEQKQVTDLVDVVICSEDTPLKKPNPDPLILCCQKMGLDPGQCAYVGDVATDIIAGKAAGMKTIGVSTGFETAAQLQLLQPDVLIHAIRDILLVIG